ncbi:ATP-binding protein [Kineococcus glutinatus]|uniref:PAS domain-containing protein n=1 Tax=Kineococcus glutinatus TaxID=1070872 RepID=A0ABP9HVH9_9ACTN
MTSMTTSRPAPGTDGPAAPPACRVELGSGPAAAGRARRAVVTALVAAARKDWADAAELAVSELVTNAALHARTAVELTVWIGGGTARVEVRDFNTALPAQRNYGEQATTGRGMALVAALSSACGVTGLPDGKVVWFELAAAEEPSEEDLLAAWGGDEWDLPAAAAPQAPRTTAQELHEVRLLAVPAALWLATRQHHDALLRELTLYAAQHEVGVDFTEVERARQTFSAAVVAAVRDAEARAPRPALPEGHPGLLPGGAGSVDVTTTVTGDAGHAAAALQDALDTAERLAAEGELLAFPGQPEVVAVRDWLCEQVQSQLAGIAPRPWPGGAQERFETVGRTTAAPGELPAAVRVVRDSDRGAVAADEANRIVAVSAPLAAALGWRVEDLLGRRIVALIPPALREAHVAGFSRHLSTGQARVIGVPLTLPVLHAAGHEVPCHFMIEQVRSPAGRPLFVAWIEPVEDGAR